MGLQHSNRRGVVALALVIVSGIGQWTVGAQEAKSSPTIVIRAGRLFDSVAGRMVDHPVIVITGNKIESVSTSTSSTSIPAATTLIDLGDATLLPGFIDVHTHLTSNAGGGGYEGLGISVPRSALIGAKNARLTLMAGFTTVRNVGAEGYADVALRDAINEGDVIGPRMQASGPPLGITGGHCDNNLLPWEFHYSAEGAADGVEAVMHKVRETVKYGADVIKFCASGGVFSKGDNPMLEQYSPAEMEVLVTESHRLGRRVATHAHSALAIKDAVRAGVDSVEHGIFLDEEGIQLMKEHKTFLVPTSYPLFWFEENAPKMNLPPWVKEKAAIIIPAAKKNMGDLFLNRSSPAMDLGSVSNWINSLEEVLKKPLVVAVPGHFELGTKADLERFRDYLRDLYSQVEKLKKSGANLEQTKAQLRMEKYKDFRQYPQYQATFADNAEVIYKELQP